MAGEARMHPAPGHGGPGKRVHRGQTEDSRRQRTGSGKEEMLMS